MSSRRNLGRSSVRRQKSKVTRGRRERRQTGSVSNNSGCGEREGARSSREANNLARIRQKYYRDNQWINLSFCLVMEHINI